MQLPAAVINDTVAAVFSDPAYNQTSLLGRFVSWLWEVVSALIDRFDPNVGAPRWSFWVMVAFAGVGLLLLLGRLMYGLYLARGERAGRSRFWAAGSGVDVDPWQLSLYFAERGDYTAAAHALYAVLLGAFERRGEVVLHESKTIGDYLRELKPHSPAERTLFREFARHYERVIYGVGKCDRVTYERLLGLVRPVAGSASARAGAA